MDTRAIEPIPPNSKKFSIHWCNHDEIRNNFWDRWWMVFDQTTCNNYEVSLYFLIKLYYEFILHQIPNYFDMRDFDDRGGGSAKNRLGTRQVGNHEHRRNNRTKACLNHVMVPVAIRESMEVKTLHAIASLTDTIIEHGTQISQPFAS